MYPVRLFMVVDSHVGPGAVPARRARRISKAVAGAMLATVVIVGQAGADAEMLSEVVVLAQKRAAELQQVPLALTTLDAAQLEARGIGDVRSLAAQVPTLGFQDSVGAPTATLRVRRVGNIGNIPTFEPAVGYFVDGAYRSRSLFATGPLLDVERTEVLRGPQTALYGKNVGGGVIAVYTREPGDRPEATAEGTLGMLAAPGDPGLAGLRASLGGPILGNLRGSLAVGGDWQEASLRNELAPREDGNALEQLGTRAQLAWTPGDRLDLRLIVGWLQRDNAEGESDVVFAPGARSTQILESLQGLGLTGSCPDNRAHDRVSCSVATNRLAMEALDATLLADYRLPNGWSLSSMTSYEDYRVRRDEDDAVQLLAPLLYFHDSEDADAVQEELRLVSTEDAVVPWMAGLFYYEGDHERGARGGRPMFGPNGPLAFDPFWQATLGLPLALPGQDGLLDSRLRTEHFAGFGQAALPLGARLTVTAAARWAREEKRASIDNAVTIPGASVVANVLTPSTSPGGEPVNGTVRRTSDDVTWSLTPQFTLDERRMLYATLARGGKFGGFNTGFGNAPLAAREFGDESIDHFEAGGRLRFGAGRGRLAASVFATRYDDYQDAAFHSAQFTVGNVPRADLEGVEVEAEYLFASGLLAELAVSYADLTYRRNTTGMCYPGRTPDGSLPGTCDLSGEHPVAAPPWSAHLGLEQPFTLGDADATLRADWNWTDRYNTSFSADPRLVQPGYHDIALRLGLQFGPSMKVVLAGENLLDETVVYYDSVLNFFNDASFQSYLGLPRRITLTLRARL